MPQVKVKEKVMTSFGESSSAYSQVDDFSHLYDRGGSELIDGKPSYTIDQAATQLLRVGASWHDLDSNGNIHLTYSFLTAPTSNFSDLEVTGFSQFNAEQKAQAALAMQSWADVANVTFTEATTGGDGHMSFGNYSGGQEGAAAFAFLPGTEPGHDGESWYLTGSGYDANKTPDVNNYGRQTLTHEIGHTLGLSHPGDYNAGEGTPTYAYAVYGQDTRGYSVMSYWSESNTSQNFSKDGVEAYSSAPLMDDIAAMQKLYGANMSTRSGDTIYGFNSNTDRDFLSATSSSEKLVFSVWDGGGNDTLDFSGFTQDQKINLHETSFSDVGGLVGNVSIAQGVTIENASGGSGNDLLIGNDAANVLKGGDGNDLIYGAGGADSFWGGAGADTFVYAASSDSTPDAPDWLMDFTTGHDKIDLSGLAEFASRRTALNFVSGLTGHAGDAILAYHAETNQTALYVDLSGTGAAGFAIGMVGQVAITDIIS